MKSIRLYRTPRNSMIAGVMGGIAERFGWNANLLRVIFVLTSVMSAAFPGLLVYLVLWMLMPKQNPQTPSNTAPHQQHMKTVNPESTP